ncbi:YybH family protein [Pseudomonas gingeri]|uniref:YybH family protein n=1 Tax=Pseudomonas gingeri TaxID=117681 RepID=UPI0015A2010D|nr:nuclear transport factor 2 family protein [Pseudomonas gingeri]NWA04514.1 nuclear transport factor 2 family protein [Pseudomonas gingeri]NWA17323.1 nuclear transport factor 2 family protein [Pseudomonas gingeri]NWA56345.1 nuclear transport factor 2 family protein [Pseudomonas gingeri]NWA98093.1 nuclear transport factor 2 family protein [Pseudomonas gingeri]NWB02539.1 nuclear transport factor 2 family protein [Pseudomonas gingeri]
MRQIRLCTAALAVGFSLFAFTLPATAADPQRPPEAAIKAENARWAQAFARGDYEAIGRLYTAEGALLPPGGAKVSGASAITAYFTQGYAGTQPGSVSFSNYEFYGDDQAVTEISDAEVRDHSGKVSFRGKQVLVFLKQGGVWKLHRDMWSDYGPLKADAQQ